MHDFNYTYHQNHPILLCFHVQYIHVYNKTNPYIDLYVIMQIINLYIFKHLFFYYIIY